MPEGQGLELLTLRGRGMKKQTEEEVPGVEEIKNGAAGLPVAPNILTLIQGACKYITWCCKGVKGMLQVKLRLKTLRWSDYPGLGGTQFYHRRV